jgi:hypothetical protein
VNILRDIIICFIALVYVNYLVFLRRLKHSGLWLGDLALPTRKRHLRLRRKIMALRLRERLAHDRLHATLVLEVVDGGPQRLCLIGFY